MHVEIRGTYAMNVRDEDALGQHTRVGAPKHPNVGARPCLAHECNRKY